MQKSRMQATHKLWYTLADFLPNWDISRGFLYVCIIYIAGRISAAVRAGDIIFFSLAAPVWRVYEPKKTGARTPDQNPLVLYIKE